MSSKKPIGRYSATKRIGETVVPSEVEVYPLQFLKQKLKWKERGERATQWLSPEDAAKTVAEPELAEIIRELCRRDAPSRQGFTLRLSGLGRILPEQPKKWPIP